MKNEDKEALDVSGIDKAVLLLELFNASKQQGMGFLQLQGASPMSLEEARIELENGIDHPYEENAKEFDYLRGRVMKVVINGSTLDPWGYDRDNGEGAAKAVVDKIRS